MYLLIKGYVAYSNYNFLFIISAIIVSIFFYLSLKNQAYRTITPFTSTVVKDSESVSVVLTKASVEVKVKKHKEIKKRVKKIVKQEAITEPKKAEVQTREIVEPKVVAESLKEETKQKNTPAVSLLDSKMKAEFIAGLYKKLSENKQYPKMAKRRKLEGVAHIHFTLLKNGKLENIFIDKSCGHMILDKAALKLVESVEVYKPIPDVVSMIALNINIPIKYSRK